MGQYGEGATPRKRQQGSVLPLRLYAMQKVPNPQRHYRWPESLGWKIVIYRLVY